MENAVKTRLQSLQFGEPQLYKNIAVVPLVAPADGTFQYHTLGEALATPNFTVTEVSTAGSVPELTVVNRSDTPVLLVDGEELAGAKQNRVLNTSILIKERSETKIPVSCTEHGRWAYSSAMFSESGHIMAHKSRSKKSSSVHCSLQSSGSFYSDQGEVWRDIEQLHAKAGSHSPSSAMSDVFKAREEDLRKSDDAFKPVPNQVGVLVFIAGTPAGLDLVSRTSAYAKLHPKLVRSYTLEGLLLEPKPGEGGSELPSAPQAPGNGLHEKARAFLHEIIAAEEHQFPSIGHGTDFRYGGPSGPPTPNQPSAAALAKEGQPSAPSEPSTLNPQPSTICGSALVHANDVIHGAFFRLDEPSATMASYLSRRRHLSRE